MDFLKWILSFTKIDAFMDTSTRADLKMFPEQKGFCYGSFQKGTSMDIGCKSGDMIVFVLSGRVRIMAEIYKEYYYAENSCFILKQSNYKLEAITDTRLIRVCLSEDWLRFYMDVKRYKGKRDVKFLYKMPSLPTHPHIESFLYDLKQRFSHNKELSQAVQDKLQRELIMLFKKSYSKKVLFGFLVALDKEVIYFHKFIMSKRRSKGMAEIIAASGLSVSTFNRKFLQIFEVSPYQWIIAKRAEDIHKHLTKTDRTVAEIMRRFHFTDYSHFNRFCKINLGASPTEIRQGTARAWT